MSSISSVGSSMSSSMVQRMQEEMFRRVDANKDNSISKDEFSALAKSGEDQGSTDLEVMFAQIDSNSDGALSRLESDAAIARAGQEMESQGTRPQGPPPGPPPAASSASESDSEATEVFDALDTNKDGTVSLEELMAAFESSDENSSSADPKSLFDSLASALQSGDLSSAKEALSALQQDAAARNGGRSDDPFSKDLQSLSDALESGSISDAQTVFSGIQEKMATHGPPRPHEAESGQSNDSSAQDTVAQTLQSLLDALDSSSSSKDDDTNATLKNILAAALNSYMQQSTGNYAQSVASGTQLSATA